MSNKKVSKRQVRSEKQLIEFKFNNTKIDIELLPKTPISQEELFKTYGKIVEERIKKIIDMK